MTNPDTFPVFTKVCRIGTVLVGRRYASLYVKIQTRLEGCRGVLSITGVEGPTASGNALGGCGQLVMSQWKIGTFAKGWNRSKVAALRDVWERWHLNDMNAGGPLQMEHLRKPEIERLWGEQRSLFKGDYYSWAKAVLKRAGLETEGGFAYGAKWHFQELPEDVLTWLQALPDADKQPAWV